MKTAALSLAAISLIQLVAAQPHKHHMHKVQHQKRDVITIVETVVAMATSVPEVVVYVDEDGKPVSTVTNGMVAATPSVYTLKPAFTPPPAPAVVPAAKVEEPSTSIVLTTSAAPAVPETTTEPAPAASPAPVSSSGGFGYSYSPYSSDGSCKSAGQVLQDFAAFDGGVGIVRTYGTDCNTVANVYPACKKYGYKHFVGLFSLNDIAGQVELIAEGVAGDWSSVYTVSVGNELVNSGQADPGSVLAAIGTAKSLLGGHGYTGPVVTVDTLQATLSHPELCNGQDYCAVNCHPFFDPNTPASEAGAFLIKSIASLRSVLANPSQRIFISETGWPTQGNSDGQAVPSKPNQIAAISSIKAAVPEAILLGPYNTMWKTSNAAQFYAEQWWGILGPCPSG